MKDLILGLLLIAFIGLISASSIKSGHPDRAHHAEELVGESSLNALMKKEVAQRPKRQFGGFGNFGQSSSQANANAFNQYQGPGSFGGSSALAGAQAFNSQGPLGGFGASAANSGSQGFNVGPGGIQGSAGFAGSQNYDLPGGHHLGISYGGSFSENNGQGSGSNSNSITYT